MKGAALALLAPSKEKSDDEKGSKKSKGGGSKELRLSAAKDILDAETPKELDAALKEYIGYCLAEKDY